jgi:hypothetical protein
MVERFHMPRIHDSCYSGGYDRASRGFPGPPDDRLRLQAYDTFNSSNRKAFRTSMVRRGWAMGMGRMMAKSSRTLSAAFLDCRFDR